MVIFRETPVAMTSGIGTRNIQTGNFETGIQINRAPLSSSFSFHQTPSQQNPVANAGDEIQMVKRLDGSMTVSGFKLSEIIELGAKATGGAILAIG
jgi:hypothetical protein